MSKTFVFGIFLLLLVSCKGDKDKSIAEDTSSYEILTEDWPKKTSPNSKTAEIIKDWEEFNALQIGLDAIYKVGNTEDLSLVLEDLIEKQKALEESTYPEAFDKPQIKSRQKVFHTFILKTKGDLIYRIDSKISVLEMIEAHNAMLNQMNSITNNTLDLKTLLEEE
ncbi:hypothetical protein FEE95_03765 [Maribacter algarum]|uniref:Uncharacterized protein n=1 Tax=Maribacter algarum (ex Zhang et al. 2020) TaxID=2578118 RepID=A0A5S3PU72_9FLAO|nr:hypothetical protein [Maribacter algarum]TMM58559.1 hypothetical protein FEE95_03765 [Maribacter algarum]